jgi:Xaa-Pro aminopeptidase
MTVQNSQPTIPPAEYRDRWRKVQEMMAQQQLDFLVAYADDRAVFGPAHARWLANFPVHFEPVCILMPRQGDPIMLVGPESDEYALLAGEISDVRVLREFTHPDEDYPYSTIQSLSEIMADTGTDLKMVRRVGLGGGGLMGAEVKAAIEVIRYAYKIAEAGLQAALETIDEGVTERAVAAEIESAMRRAGAEGTGIDTIVASGPNSRPILARSTFRRIQANELVLLTLAPRYEGYHAAIGRPVLLGDPGSEILQAVDVAARAQQACYEAMRPGIEGREVEAIGRRIVEEGGLGPYFLYSGVHSLGVVEFEPPIFGPSSNARLEPTMIISIDIPMFNTPWGGLRIEDGYLITDSGSERLHETPYEIKK